MSFIYQEPKAMLYRFFNIKYAIFVMALTFLSISQGLATSSSPDQSNANTYNHIFYSGEGIHIDVLGEEQLSRNYTIDEAGMILMPLIGKLHIAKRSAQEIETILTQTLQDGYINNPIISVTPLEHHIFYILGEVRNPGRYNIPPGSVTVLNAVALAGGFTPHARKKNFEIVRSKGEDKYHTENNSAYTDLRPGDIIIVKERFF